MDKDKRIEYLEAKIKRLKENPVSTKESIVKNIGKELGEDAIEIKTYESIDGKKSYEGLKQFYWDLMTLKKDVLSELYERIRKIDKDGGRT